MQPSEMTSQYPIIPHKIQIFHYEIDRIKIRNTMLWIFGTIIMAGIMILQVRPLFYEYNYNNLGTQMTIIARNDTVTPPKLVFCVPYSPISLEAIATYLQPWNNESCSSCDRINASGFMNIDKLRDNISFENDTEKDKWRISGFIFKHFMSLGDLSLLDLANASWNQPILESIWDVFECIGDFDNDTTLDDNECMIRYDAESLLNQRSTLDVLFQKLTSIICQHVKIQINTSMENRCQEVLRLRQSHMFNNHFCFKVLNDLLETDFTIRVDSLNDQGVRFEALENRSIAFEIFYGTDLLLWPLGTPETSHALFMSDTGHQETVQGHEEAILKYLPQSSILDLKRSDCYWETTYEGCMANCIDSRRMDCYQCVPFTFRNGPMASTYMQSHPDASYCNHMQYQNPKCQNFEVTCRPVCESPCKYINYQWHSTQRVITGGRSRRFTLKIKAIEAPYVQFELVEAQTFQQFLSSLAGMFNLFLGFSGATLIGLCVECIDCFKKWKAKNKDKVQDEGAGRKDYANSNEIVMKRLDEIQTRFRAYDADMKIVKEKLDMRKNNRSMINDFHDQYLLY